MSKMIGVIKIIFAVGPQNDFWSMLSAGKLRSTVGVGGLCDKMDYLLSGVLELHYKVLLQFPEPHVFM